MWHRLAIQLFCSFSTLPLYALVSQVYTIQFLYLGSPEHNEWIRKNLHPSLSIFLINHHLFANALNWSLRDSEGPFGASRCHVEVFKVTSVCRRWYQKWPHLIWTTLWVAFFQVDQYMYEQGRIEIWTCTNDLELLSIIAYANILCWIYSNL